MVPSRGTPASPGFGLLGKSVRPFVFGTIVLHTEQTYVGWIKRILFHGNGIHVTWEDRGPAVSVASSRSRACTLPHKKSGVKRALFLS
jgi:hypothetical protein